MWTYLSMDSDMELIALETQDLHIFIKGCTTLSPRSSKPFQSDPPQMSPAQFLGFISMTYFSFGLCRELVGFFLFQSSVLRDMSTSFLFSVFLLKHLFFAGF